MVHPVIATRDLTKHYGHVAALEGLDLEVHPGEVFGFLGPNGAGKSTLIRLLLDLIRPTRGAAWILGRPVHDVEQVHRHVGYLPGDVSLWPQLTGTETLDLLGQVTGGTDPAHRAELVERFQLDPSVRVRSLSRGTRQKVALVAALMSRAELLLLDEPTAGLDPLMEAEFQAVVREAASRGQTVFLSSHILAEVEDLCDRVGMLRAGLLVEVAALEDLRRMHTTVYDLTVDGPAPELSDVPGVTSVETTPTGLRVSVAGAPTALLARLAGCSVTRLTSEELSLEQIFLTYY
ncbi:ATP-binding cassette domain-containing protein [Cellulomonas soli]|uniref:ABC transporter ATP-binding protein n=1 Tax=Cellulomonas soli TaxID=931535 RepID=UPI003F837A05